MAEERVTYRRGLEVVTVTGRVLGPYRPDKKRVREVLVVLGGRGMIEVPADLVIERRAA